MPRDTKRRVLLQALELVGNRHELAALLGAGRAQMDNWLADASEIPESYSSLTGLRSEADALLPGRAHRR